MMKNELEIKTVELTFKDVKISCPIDDGHRMIPVKTVCKIIDVNYTTQDSWLKEHPFFSQLYLPRGTVGGDNKQRIMNCLSIFDIDGWIHSIGAKGRKEGSIEKQYLFLAWLRDEKLKLYKSIETFLQENKYELDLIESKGDLIEDLQSAQADVKEIKSKINKVNSSLDDVREKRYTGQTALPFPK